MGSRSFIILQFFTFLGAALLFTLEPLVGRLLLPKYGGSFHVWTTCLMLFQLLLLLGYFYCHVLAKHLGRWHLLFAALPLILMPLQIRGTTDVHSPIWSLTVTVVYSIALPFIVLSSTSVMAQTWFARSDAPERKHPYQLYSASNIGAIFGLLCYPIVIEPFMTLKSQKWLWTAVYLIYFAMTWLASRTVTDAGATDQTAENLDSGKEPTATPNQINTALELTAKKVSWGRMAYWFWLSALPSCLLIAVTNVLTNDIGSFPFLWVAPLILYTLTFVFIFRPKPIIDSVGLRFIPEILAGFLILTIAGHLYLRWHETPIHLIVFFSLTLAAHRELYRSRPEESQLTQFYLVMSVGGAAGGAFVTLIAPLIFTGLHEYSLGIGLLAVVLGVGRFVWAKNEKPEAIKLARALAIFVCFLTLGVSWNTAFPDRSRSQKIIYTYRNYYGIHRIIEEPTGRKDKAILRQYAHGTTIHGAQISTQKKDPQPLTYYHKLHRIGQFLTQLPSRPHKIAVIGLGTGSLAVYTRPQDEMTFFELDPDNERIARDYFDFLGAAKGQVNVVAGDARLMIEKYAEDASYDILVVDAFSSDVVPVHLLTKEALSLYQQKLKPGGHLFFHVSNRIYKFKPILFTTCQSVGLKILAAAPRESGESSENSPYFFPAEWYVVIKEDRPAGYLRKLGWASVNVAMVELDPWTDDYASAFVLLWKRFAGQ
jgi:hypothetical protein